jgi:hypothetical protein
VQVGDVFEVVFVLDTVTTVVSVLVTVCIPGVGGVYFVLARRSFCDSTIQAAYFEGSFSDLSNCRRKLRGCNGRQLLVGLKPQHQHRCSVD